MGNTADPVALLQDTRYARATVRALKQRAGTVNFAAETALFRAEQELAVAIDELRAQ